MFPPVGRSSQCNLNVPRLKRNRSIQPYFHFFVPTLIRMAPHFWGGTQRALLSKRLSVELMLLFISGLHRMVLLRSKTCTESRTLSSRRTGSWTKGMSSRLYGCSLVERRETHSIASTDVATEAVRRGASLITHLFNAMPQLHHRDPSIIGLLGASPHINGPFSPITITPPVPTSPASSASLFPIYGSPRDTTKAQSEAFDDHETPPQTPRSATTRAVGKVPRLGLHLDKGEVADLEFERPFYELIVDGIHSHPNSVRVRPQLFTYRYIV